MAEDKKFGFTEFDELWGEVAETVPVKFTENSEVFYYIDWDKVQNFDDLKRIIMAFDISFTASAKYFDTIKDLVKK